MSLGHRSLNEKVYEAIKNKIISSKYSSGVRLQEDPLANSLGTSKTPIKLALARLEQEGFVHTLPRRGTYVIQLTKEMMIEIYSLREVLEGLAARLAARNVTDEELEKMDKNLSRFGSKENGPSLKEYLSLDESFHSEILNATKHRYLKEALGRMYDLITMFKLRAATVRHNSTEPYDEHTHILQALKARQPKLAEEAMRFHIQQVMNVLLENFDQRG